MVSMRPTETVRGFREGPSSAGWRAVNTLFGIGRYIDNGHALSVALVF